MWAGLRARCSVLAWWPRLAAEAAMRFRRGRVERVAVIRVGLGL
jgi:hypothetical protein